MRVRGENETRPSGIPWVGAIPTHWGVKRAKFLFSLAQRQPRESDGIVTAFRDGQVTLRSNRRTDGFTNALKEAGYQGVRKGDLVIHAMDAFAGAVGVSDSDGKCTPVYSCCVPNGAATSDFYARCVRTMATTGYIESLSKGIRERSTDFRWGTFAEQFLPVPPLSEQRELSAFMDRETARVDAMIAKKTRFIELLREKRQALISRAVTKGPVAGIPMKDSGVEWLGDVPAHWAIGRLRDFTESISTGPFGTALRASDYVTGGIPVVNPSHLSEDGCRPDSDVTVSNEVATRLAAWQLRPGDVVTARRGELGRGSIVEPSQAGWICGTGSMRVRPLGKRITPEFIHAFLLSAPARAWLEYQSVGSTMPNLNEALLGSLPIAVPPLEEQRALLSELTQSKAILGLLAIKTERSIELLREHRTALITAAVTGKVDLRGVAQRTA